MKHLFLKILIPVLLLAAGAAALCLTRWSIFFGATTERSFSPQHGPSAIVMTAGADGLVDRSFSFTTALPDTCLFILTLPDGSEDTVPAPGTLVSTMGGDQYFHDVCFAGLCPGDYSFRIVPQAGDAAVSGAPFSVRPFSLPSDTLSFLVFGDLLLDRESPEGQLGRLIGSAPFDAVLYTGNIVRECTYPCWQAWYRSASALQAAVPQLGVPGSRDYEHGIHRDRDPRWTARFPMPLNGPGRFLGTSCFVDYPAARLFFLDTEDLELVSDYTVLQSWLERHLAEVTDRWKIVVMHHSVHSASAGFDHPRLFTYLHRTLDHADLIFSGNDLTYMRRSDISLSDIIREQHTVPVYVVLTSDSTEAAVPKCSPLDHRIGSDRAFYTTVALTADTLAVRTCYLNWPDSLYDAFTVAAADRVVLEADSLPAEVIEMPAAHADGGIRARRFEHLRDARLRYTAVK